MTEHLFGFVARLHAQGHTPQKIYDALVTRIPTKLARQLVHKVTGCVIGRRTRVMTDEARANLSAARKGIPHRPPSRETRRKIAASRKGQTQSQEARDLISAAVTQRWAVLAEATPTRICAREGCEAIVEKATMRYCSEECRQIARRAQGAESYRRYKERRSKIKRYTGHPGHPKTHAVQTSSGEDNEALKCSGPALDARPRRKG